MIQDFADWLVYGLFGLSADTPLGVAVNFFFYDTIKILILLFFISVLMGIINAYFPIERLRNYLVTHMGCSMFWPLFSEPLLRSVPARPFPCLSAL